MTPQDALAAALHELGIGCMLPRAASRNVCVPTDPRYAHPSDAAAMLAALTASGWTLAPVGTEGLPERIARWERVCKVVYGGVDGGTMPATDADQLRAIADWLDRVDDAADDALAGRATIDRTESLQDTLRRIAAALAQPAPDSLREALDDAMQTLLHIEGDAAHRRMALRAALEAKP